ncbi:MAG: phytoene/squalene synthase family protein [Bacteroidetes bacterium]|nr:MAG: phytoene/squalene synthase family protein [Bacteroidota bacterium]
MISLYHQTCNECSKLVTNRYSTSFSLGIRVFAKQFRLPIYAIYGYVRFADEIVDTFHGYDKAALLSDFRAETWKAIADGVSMNPILHSFQAVVRQYGIERELIEAFLDSMEMDLHNNVYQKELYEKYIYGSAEVVGLMCLRVFCEGDSEKFDTLKESARSLGAAFQKVNFLRDLGSDFDERGRVYFPGVDFNDFSPEDKKLIEDDIMKDFRHAYEGIVQLPAGARLGVYLAYVYYLDLFRKIRKTAAEKVRQQRIRVPNSRKFYLLATSAMRMSLNML